MAQPHEWADQHEFKFKKEGGGLTYAFSAKTSGQIRRGVDGKMGRRFIVEVDTVKGPLEGGAGFSEEAAINNQPPKGLRDEGTNTMLGLKCHTHGATAIYKWMMEVDLDKRQGRFREPDVFKQKPADQRAPGKDPTLNQIDAGKQAVQVDMGHQNAKDGQGGFSCFPGVNGSCWAQDSNLGHRFVTVSIFT